MLSAEEVEQLTRLRKRVEDWFSTTNRDMLELRPTDRTSPFSGHVARLLILWARSKGIVVHPDGDRIVFKRAP